MQFSVNSVLSHLMQVLTVFVQIPWILHFSRPYPSFKWLYSTAHLPYITVFYFSNWISCIENINVACPFHVRIDNASLVPPSCSICMALQSSKCSCFPVAYGILGHLLSFSMTFFDCLGAMWPLHWSIASRLNEHMGASEVIATSPLACHSCSSVFQSTWALEWALPVCFRLWFWYWRSR